MGAAATRTRLRAITQAGFFALFILAPALDLLRFDLNAGHAIFFGNAWTLGLDALTAREVSPTSASLRMLLVVFLPIIATGALLLLIAWRFGRVYCGWLCPHFSVVELINRSMRRASGKPSIWERRMLPEKQPDGTRVAPNRWFWLPTAIAIFAFAFLWALVLLTYLQPPREIYAGLLSGSLTRNQTLFLTVATIIFVGEFSFARHLFCRFGCAIGLFQSMAWMANDRAMVVGFDTGRARSCHSCNNACDAACPMRLKPRGIKRAMFACTACGECVTACETVQGREARRPLLDWVSDEAARAVTGSHRRAKSN